MFADILIKLSSGYTSPTAQTKIVFLYSEIQPALNELNSTTMDYIKDEQKRYTSPRGTEKIGKEYTEMKNESGSQVGQPI